MAERRINENVYAIVLLKLLRNQPKQTTMELGIKITVRILETP